MARKLRRALLALSLLALAGTAFATAEVAANLQTKPRKYPLSRTKAGSTVRATSANTIHVRACPDAANLTVATGADTVGDCAYLSYSSSDKTWYLRKELLGPTSDYGRRAFSLYFTNGVGADTLIGSGYVLDEEPGSQVVDGYSIADRTVTSTDVDSTSGFTINTTYQTRINLRETGASGVGIYAPYGTADATGYVFQLGGSGSSIGKALFIKDWNGYGLHLTRKAATASGQDAVFLDLSAETDTASTRYGERIDYAGTGKIHGLYLTRQSGTTKFSKYGLKIEALSTAQNQSGSINYGAYIRAAATVTGTSKNIGLQLSATSTAGGRALYTPEGDVQLGDSGDADSVLVYNHLAVIGETTFDQPLGVAGPFAGSFTIDDGTDHKIVTVAGFDSGTDIVVVTPQTDWGTGNTWYVTPGTGEFTVELSAAVSGAQTGSYMVVRVR